MVWASRFGTPGVTTTIESIDAAWGSASGPGYTPGNGTPTDVFLWQEGPTQDGNPSDATLLVSIPTTVQSVDTDTYVNFPLSSPLSITGYFFVGSHQVHLAGQYVLPVDDVPNPAVNESWFFGSSGVADYSNPGANPGGTYALDQFFPGQVLIRANCTNRSRPTRLRS